jgi:peroxiredoxin
MRRFILGWEIVAFAVMLSVGAVTAVAKDPDLSAGNTAPTFIATRLDGKTVKFPDQFKGKIVMLDFWATWCAPCVKEMPNVVANFDKYHSDGLAGISVSMDQAGDKEKVQKFIEDKKMHWNQIFDGKYFDAAVAKQYGIHSIPHLLLIDGDTGRIIANDVGGKDLGPAIEKALAEKKKDQPKNQ